MSHDVALILWQGGAGLTLALAWIGLWQLPFMQRYQGSTAPVNGVLLVFSAVGFFSGVCGFVADNWLLYALMALGLSMVLVAVIVPLLYWRFRALLLEAGHSLLAPLAMTGVSLMLFGLLRLLLWLMGQIWSVVWWLAGGIINAF